MLTLQALRHDRPAVEAALAKRGLDAAPLLDQILELDLQRRTTQKEVDDLKAEQNMASRAIGDLFNRQKEEAAPAPGRRSERIHALDEKQRT